MKQRVLEGITVGDKTKREHLEVINHRDAISYVEDIVHKEEPFSEWQIEDVTSKSYVIEADEAKLEAFQNFLIYMGYY